jgi:N-acetylglucosamine transport system permease protein
VHHQKYRLIIPFVLPSIALYATFVLYPFAQAFYNSLTQWRGVSANKKFTGLDNYRWLLDDEKFFLALKHNAQLLMLLPLVTISLALLFAALFTQGGQGVRGSNFYRVVFFFPQVMSVVIIGILWQYIYTPNSGLLNGTLRSIGLESLQRTWLGDPAYALWSIAVVVIWQAVGFYMILFVAGMQSIPTSFYEAARLDGATRWSSFRDITFPLIWDNVRIAVVYIAIVSLDLFTIVQVMTEGGPNHASDVVARYMYEVGFTNSQFGRASAIGVVLLLLTLVLSMIPLRFTLPERLAF